MAVKKNERVLCGDASRHFDLFYKNPEKSLTNSDRSDIIIKLTTSAEYMRQCWNWQTGTFEGRVFYDVRVQVPFAAPSQRTLKWRKYAVSEFFVFSENRFFRLFSIYALLSFLSLSFNFLTVALIGCFFGSAFAGAFTVLARTTLSFFRASSIPFSRTSFALACAI